LSHFFAYVTTQYGASIKAVQCDNGREFDNASSRMLFLTHGAHLRMSCPYTSAQNGKAERVIRSTNNIIRSLLFQARMPPSYWVEALHTATVLFNILPTKTLGFVSPQFALHGKLPSYDHLRVFGCACYPNLATTAANKLAPRSTLCVFLGYSPHHKGYRCLDRSTNRVIISRHVSFDETLFPFAEPSRPVHQADFEFLDDFATNVPVPIGPTHSFLPTGPPGDITAQPRAAPDALPPGGASATARTIGPPPQLPATAGSSSTIFGHS
jgi:hypothetical protein